MSYPVKWFHSDMAGAPELTAVPGSMIAMLKACLINGFNLHALDSLTYDSGTGLATGTVSAGHGYEKHQVITISGADQVEYNGEVRVVSVDTTTFTFAPAAAPSVTPATGTSMQAQVAPVGNWQVAFEDGASEKAMFQSTDPEATGCLVYLDDSNTVTGWNQTSADVRVFGVETATDLSNYTGEYGHGWWRKHKDSQGTAITPTKWVLVGDGRLFYFFAYADYDQYNLYTGSSNCVFGDINSYRPADGYSCMLVSGSNVEQEYACTNRFFDALWFESRFFPRAHHQIAGEVRCIFLTKNWIRYLGGSNGGLEFPNAANNGLLLDRDLLVVEHPTQTSYSSTAPSGAIVRGTIPGMVVPLHPAPLPHRHVLEDVTATPGSHLLAVLGGQSQGAGTQVDDVAQVLFDLAGPWRA